ncbi:hypothetical protein ACHQM5_009461 [Ranunculus cassubicifolius]
MDAKKALYRAKLKESAQKKDKRIDSPLIRYNDHDQPICRICDVLLKSESLWAAHQASRKHHEAITKYKANAAGQARNIPKSVTPTELVQKTQPSSMLPADFFDKNETKRPKSGTGNNIETDTLKGSAKASASISSENILGKRKGNPAMTEEPIASQMQIDKPSNVHAISTKGRKEIAPPKQLSHTAQKSSTPGVRGALPEGFFDKMDVEETREVSGSEVKQVNGSRARGSIPEGFFDKEDGQTNSEIGGVEVKQGKGNLPEGFFDNKDADLRARGIEPVKVDPQDEYKEFEKLIQEDLHEVDERYEEEEIDAAEVREEEETLEQKAYLERVEMLKKKQLELKAARFGGQKNTSMEKDSSSDDDSSSDEDEDAVDWRAKHM